MGTARNNDSQQVPEIEPSVFLTNLPAIVGFYPRGQVVIAALYRRHAEDNASRAVDLNPTMAAGPMLIKELVAMESDPELVRAAAEFLLEEGCTRADVYVIDESWGVEKDSTPIVQWLREAGMHEVRLAGVAAIAAGEVVTDDKGEIVGIVGDSLMTSNASLLSEHGQEIFDSYAEYCDYFRADQFRDEEDRKQIEKLRNRAVEADGPRHLRIGADNNALIQHFNTLSLVVEAVDDGVLDAASAVRNADSGFAIAMALTNLTLRDMSMTFISSPLAGAMAKIWHEAAIVHRGMLRANALSCFAIAKFAEGLENYGQTALVEASHEDPDHSLTHLLEVAAANDILPRCVGTILGAAQEVVHKVYKMRHPLAE